MNFWYKALTVTCLGIALFLTEKGLANSVITNVLLNQTTYQIASAYGTQTVYSISRNGKNIGTHTLSFQGDANELTVVIDSSITVRILGIPVYRLTYQAEELWQNEALISATATTTENGDANTVSLNNRPDDTGVGFASNHWHPGVLTGNSVFNTLTGDISNIAVANLGTENVETASGKTITAARYQYQDDIQANVWYDENGLWLMMTFKGEDGSVIRYLRSD